MEDKGDGMCITFQKSKNDQFHRGSSTVLTANGQILCPVRLLRVYFKRLGLRFVKGEEDKTPLHFRIRKVGSKYYADKELAPGQRVTGKGRAAGTSPRHGGCRSPV